jgi:hypothetical protein
MLVNDLTQLFVISFYLYLPSAGELYQKYLSVVGIIYE